jgi:DNA invertase Pin-like site-specific DNA recombinase
MKKIGIYIRVSTEEQKSKGISLHDQEQRGIEFCKNNNYDYEIFEDGGISGETPIEKRPALNLLIEKLLAKPIIIDGEKVNEFYGIYVVEIDRLTRDTKIGRFIKETLIENKIKLFVSDGKETNFDDPSDNLMWELKSLLSEFENKKTKVRIRNTLKRNTIDGKAGGGKLLNYGYTKDKSKMLIIDDNEAPVVKKIFKLSIEGYGTKKISHILNEENIPTKRMTEKAKMIVREQEKVDFIWRDSVIYKLLTNPIYKGKRLFKGEFYDCPAIIEENAFDAVQELLKNRKNTKDTTNKYFYLLKGVIYCAKCGSRMYGRKRIDLSDNQYICSSQRYSKNYCGNRGINIDKIEKKMVDSIINLPIDYITYIESIYSEEYKSNNNKTIQFLQKLKKEKEIEIDKIMTLFTSDLLDGTRVTKKINELSLEVSNIESDINRIEENTKFYKEDKEIFNALKTIASDTSKNKENYTILREIIKGIIKQIKIYWDEKALIHHILVDYKITNVALVIISKEIEIQYEKSGWHLKINKLNKDSIITIKTPNPRLSEIDTNSTYINRKLL